MPYGLSAEEIEWVRESYRMFRQGDPAFMDRFAPDARLSFPTTLPAGGTYESPFEAMEYFTTIGEQFEDASPTPEEFLRVEDCLFVFGTFRGRSRETGEEFAARFLHSLRMSGEGSTLTEQKIVSFELFIDTAAVLRALGRSVSSE
jgi:ketosteroid isomerase-like protein